MPDTSRGVTDEAVITMPSGERLVFGVADGATAPPLFCLGVRKSGSTMLFKLIAFLARRNGMNVVDIPGTMFRAGYTVRDWRDLDLTSLIRPGNIYTGFRAFPTKLAATDAFRSSRKLFLYRDPRDALVSQFFSDAYSHGLPSTNTETGAAGAQAFLRKREAARELGLERFVEQMAGPMARTLQAYAPLLSDPLCLSLRYEDVILRKRELIEKILAHFGWSCTDADRDSILSQLDVVPKVEVERSFVRRVVPGDHREKLSAEAIARLDSVLAPVLSRFGYG